ESCALGKEVLVRPLQVLERVLQRMHWRIFEPRRFAAIAPSGQMLGHGHVTDVFLTRLVIGLLQGQRLVEDEPAGPGKAAHVALLLAIGHEFVFEGLEALHGRTVWIYSSSIGPLRGPRYPSPH